MDASDSPHGKHSGPLSGRGGNPSLRELLGLSWKLYPLRDEQNKERVQHSGRRRPLWLALTKFAFKSSRKLDISSPSAHVGEHQIITSFV